MTKSLAWPVVVGTAIIYNRKSLENIFIELSRSIKKITTLKVGNVSVVTERLEEAINSSENQTSEITHKITSTETKDDEKEALIKKLKDLSEIKGKLEYDLQNIKNKVGNEQYIDVGLFLDAAASNTLTKAATVIGHNNIISHYLSGNYKELSDLSSGIIKTIINEASKKTQEIIYADLKLNKLIDKDNKLTQQGLYNLFYISLFNT